MSIKKAMASRPLLVTAAIAGCALLVLYTVATFQLRDPPPSWTPPAEGIEPLGPGAGFLRGAHWFGNGWAVNVWNTQLLPQARRDFADLRADGFNTVILVIPWAGFMDSPQDQEIDAERLRRLDGLLGMAAEERLNVVLRVGYAWDASVLRSGGWNVQLWLDESARAGWLAYLAALGSLVDAHPHVQFGFISWEDLWSITGAGERELARRLRIAERSGYRRWLKDHYSLSEVAKRYEQPFQHWEQVPVPERFHPSFALFFSYLDYAWIERFFKPAQSVFPRLSMEIRVDVDPVWKAPGIIDHYHEHHAAWRLPDAPWTTIYWSPAMGGDNRGESITPRTAAKRLEEQLSRIREVIGEQPIFLGQFLVQDFTPGYEHNGKLDPDGMEPFLQRAVEVLRQHAHGYALWAWRDYRHNAVPSPDFSSAIGNWLGQTGPVVEGGYRLPAGERLERTFLPHEFHVAGGGSSAQLCVQGHSVDGQAVSLRADIEPGGQSLLLELQEETEDCVAFSPGPEHTRIILESQVSVVLHSVEIFGFVQPIGMRDRSGNPKPEADAWRVFNQQLVNSHRQPSP